MKINNIHVYGIDQYSKKNKNGIREIRLCGTYCEYKDAEQAIKTLSEQNKNSMYWIENKEQLG